MFVVISFSEIKVGTALLTLLLSIYKKSSGHRFQLKCLFTPRNARGVLGIMIKPHTKVSRLHRGNFLLCTSQNYSIHT